MGPLGQLSVGLAAKPAVPKVSLGVFLLASWILDVFAIALAFTGIERAEIGNPWSHGLFMSVVRRRASPAPQGRKQSIPTQASHAGPVSSKSPPVFGSAGVYLVSCSASTDLSQYLLLKSSLLQLRAEPMPRSLPSANLGPQIEAGYP